MVATPNFALKFPKLQALYLAGTALSEAGVAQLAAAHFPALKHLHLSGLCIWGGEAMATLLVLKSPSYKGASAIVQVLHADLPQLEHLVLQFPAADPHHWVGGSAEDFAAMEMRSLRWLTLVGTRAVNGLGAATLPRLEHLQLVDCDLSAKSAEQLAHRYSAQLVSFELEHCGGGWQGREWHPALETLAQRRYSWPRLQTLAVGCRRRDFPDGSRPMPALVARFAAPALTTLKLYNARFGEWGEASLDGALAELTHGDWPLLQDLDMAASAFDIGIVDGHTSTPGRFLAPEKQQQLDGQVAERWPLCRLQLEVPAVGEINTWLGSGGFW